MLTGDKSRQSRESFIFYDSMLAALLEIGEHDAFLFLKAIKNYRAGLEVKFDQPIKQALWQATFKGQFDRDAEKYLAMCEKNKVNGSMGGQYGKLGGRPRKTTKNPQKPRAGIQKPRTGGEKPPKTPDTDTDTDTESESESEYEKEREEKTPLAAADLSLASLNLNHPKNTGEVVAEAEKHCVRISESQAQDFIDSNSVTAQGETWMFRNTPVRDWRKLMNSRWLMNWKRDNAKNEDDETPDVFKRIEAKRAITEVFRESMTQITMAQTSKR